MRNREIIKLMRDVDAKASKGPWQAQAECTEVWSGHSIVCCTSCSCCDGLNHSDDSTFIVIARNAWPRIIDYIAKLEYVADTAKEYISDPLPFKTKSAEGDLSDALQELER